MADRVTWLLPIKDGMPYLPETLASIEAQTYPHWEVLAWDNGSTDGTVEELRKWIPSRLPGRIVTDQPLTLGESLARMVELCGTEFCARIDADDVSLPERLECQVAFLREHEQVAVVGSQAHYIWADGSYFATSRLPLSHDEIIACLPWANRISHPSVLLRRSAVLRAGNYRTVGPPGVNIEDYDLWFRISVDHELRNMEIPLIYQRLHEKSTTYLAIREGRLRDALGRCFLDHADAVFGLSEKQSRFLLKTREYMVLLPYIILLRYYSKKHYLSMKPMLILPSLAGAARDYAAPWDLVSRFSMALLEGRRSAVRDEIYGTAKHTLRLLRLFDTARAMRGHLKRASAKKKGTLQDPGHPSPVRTIPDSFSSGR